MRKILLVLVLLIAAVAGGALLALRQAPQWTTDSEAALEAFEAGLEAGQKLYADEAGAHFARAVELDPSFAAAKLFLLRSTEGRYDEGLKAELTEGLRAVDLSTLNDRERFLIERQLAFADDEHKRAQQLLERYADRHPEDPFALDVLCAQQWQDGDFDAATVCFRRLIEIDPNWVRAQNLMGYMAMAKGEWKEAEEQFEIYRYLAPDQANPHDSLGELLLLTGRWDEARQQFEEALAAKPDFCASWGNLVRLAIFRADFAEAGRLADRAEATGECGAYLKDADCRIAVWKAYAAGDWAAVWETYQAPVCEDCWGETTVLAFESAILAGHHDEAAALQKRLEEMIGEHRGDFDRAFLLHLEAIRLRFEGEPEAAIAKLREADSLLAYQDARRGYFKLANSLELVSALRLAGKQREADRVLAGARAVNPALVESWLTSLPDAAAPRLTGEADDPGGAASPGG